MKDNNIEENILSKNIKNKVYLYNKEKEEEVDKNEEQDQIEARQKKLSINQKKKGVYKRYFSWPVKIFVLTFFLTLFFSVSSELVLSTTGIILSVLIIIVFFVIAVLSDMLGVAITCCNSNSFQAMASKKIKGSKEALFLLRNTDKFASLCNDVVGDFCGILSGAAGATISVKIILSLSLSSVYLEILIASLISSVVAALTVFGNALGKKIAIERCEKIVLFAGKFLSLFKRKSK